MSVRPTSKGKEPATPSESKALPTIPKPQFPSESKAVPEGTRTQRPVPRVRSASTFFTQENPKVSHTRAVSNAPVLNRAHNFPRDHVGVTASEHGHTSASLVYRSRNLSQSQLGVTASEHGHGGASLLYRAQNALRDQGGVTASEHGHGMGGASRWNSDWSTSRSKTPPAPNRKAPPAFSSSSVDLSSRSYPTGHLIEESTTIDIYRPPRLRKQTSSGLLSRIRSPFFSSKPEPTTPDVGTRSSNSWFGREQKQTRSGGSTITQSIPSATTSTFKRAPTRNSENKKKSLSERQTDELWAELLERSENAGSTTTAVIDRPGRGEYDSSDSNSFDDL